MLENNRIQAMNVTRQFVLKVPTALRTLSQSCCHRGSSGVKPTKMSIAAAAERNKEAIAGVLSTVLPTTSASVLEVASGTGQHVVHFAQKFPHIQWQPSDLDPDHLRSISTHIANLDVSKNVQQPLQLDITQPVEDLQKLGLTFQSFDFVLNSNMIHISPWDTSVGIFRTAKTFLKPHGVLFFYGPFKVNGVLTPESNVQFDASLRSRDTRWGVRDIADLNKLADQNGFRLEKTVDMPANNKCVVFCKVT